MIKRKEGKGSEFVHINVCAECVHVCGVQERVQAAGEGGYPLGAQLWLVGGQHTERLSI